MKQPGKASVVEVITHKRTLTVTISTVERDAQPPSSTAVKIGTDAELDEDVYAEVAYAWVIS